MSNCNIVRCGSVAAIIAVPVLGVAFLANFVSSSLTGTSDNADTREFNRNRQSLTVPAANTATPTTNEIYLGDWQNTVRTPPSPRV